MFSGHVLPAGWWGWVGQASGDQFFALAGLGWYFGTFVCPFWAGPGEPIFPPVASLSLFLSQTFDRLYKE